MCSRTDVLLIFPACRAFLLLHRYDPLDQFIQHELFAIVSVLVQAVLILMAAISLVAAGLMMATHMPDAHTLAKRAIMVYMVLIIANAFLMQATVKTTVGGLFALTFGVTGILMGVVLMKVLEAQTTETTRFKQGGHQNA
jgi:hypothetical protein